MLIPYGAGRLPSNAFGTLIAPDGGAVLTCRLRHVAIDRARRVPLRLNGGQLEFRDEPGAQAVSGARAQTLYIRDLLKSYCDTFQATPRLFLDCYFDFILDRIATERAELEAALDPYGAMYEVGHWAFSAWLPLPQAHLDLRPEPVASPPAADDLLRADVAFWSGERFIVVETGGGMATARRTAALGRARAAGMLIVDAPAETLAGDAGDADAFFRAAFAPAFARFWDGQRYPSGPFRPRGLDLAPRA
jgi:hypothetical protein